MVYDGLDRGQTQSKSARINLLYKIRCHNVSRDAGTHATSTQFSGRSPPPAKRAADVFVHARHVPHLRQVQRLQLPPCPPPAARTERQQKWNGVQQEWEWEAAGAGGSVRGRQWEREQEAAGKQEAAGGGSSGSGRKL